MRNFRSLCKTLISTFLIALFVGPIPAARADDGRVDYNRDIRPIFSNVCYTCHGPDEAERQTEFRLDTKTSALSELESGNFAIVPGKSAESELYRRIVSQDPDERMPPPDSGKVLTADQISSIEKWIDQGANWALHWSFIAPSRSSLPIVRNKNWPRNEIDHFILARLESENLKPSPPADKTTSIRRVTLDLTGLPPTLEELGAFSEDDSPDAYEKVVDRLLGSPRYGEHAARYWLDLARYGDTHGLHFDNERSLWPYRDWVIKAIDENMPFDRFTIEQLAGDLLPDPTRRQLIATGFNRCNVTTNEGGSISEEYRVRYATDRVETTFTVWQGITIGCAVCHEHKFDPFSQKEFYQLFAYFGSLTENPMDKNILLPPPFLKLPTPQQAELQQRFRRQIELLEKTVQTEVVNLEYVDPRSEPLQLKKQEFVWIDDELPTGSKPSGKEGTPEGWRFVSKSEHPVHSGSKSSMQSAKGTSQHYFTEADQTMLVGKGDVLFTYVYLDPQDPPEQIMLQFNDGSWEHRAYWGKDLIDWGQANSASRRKMGSLPELGNWVRLEVPVAKVGLKPGSDINGWAFTQHGGTVYWDRAGIVSRIPQDGSWAESLLIWQEVQKINKDPALPKSVQQALRIERTKRKKSQHKRIRDHFVEYVYSGGRDFFEPLHEQTSELKKRAQELEKQIPGTMIMQDMEEPRDTFVLVRGQYDKPDQDQKVMPGVPSSLPSLRNGAPANRLGLAQWLVDPSNPLTARVTVNRFWQQYFGTGIVKTSEDFGSQGDWPSHPGLLDWLATEFVQSGWDVKHIRKLIVTSATYRQSSSLTSELKYKDPENRLLARGPRFRMDAEMIRDQALSVSGLLVEQNGGSSVKAYQPAGLWHAVGYTNSNTANFVQDSGKSLYRRSMYTFWKRTCPPPSMAMFDAPTRETCVSRRARTNTPLQALVLLNDTQFVEAAKHLAQRMMTEAGNDPEDRIRFAFRLATARPPSDDETKIILELYLASLAEYSRDQESALQLLSIGDSPIDEELDASELAAWTMVANLILNLDETITKG